MTKVNKTHHKNEREAFKAEDRRIEADGGVKSDTNYNQINSPGRNKRIQDGEKVTH